MLIKIVQRRHNMLSPKPVIHECLSLLEDGFFIPFFKHICSYGIMTMLWALINYACVITSTIIT